VTAPDETPTLKELEQSAKRLRFSTGLYQATGNPMPISDQFADDLMAVLADWRQLRKQADDRWWER
jgi:hypothetical protein